MRSKASRVTCADGLVPAQAVGISACEVLRMRSMKPAIGTLRPAERSKISSPRASGGQLRPRTKSSNVALLGAKVLVSCWKPPMAIFIERLAQIERAQCNSAPVRSARPSNRLRGCDRLAARSSLCELLLPRRAYATGGLMRRRGDSERKVLARLMEHDTKLDPCCEQIFQLRSHLGEAFQNLLLASDFGTEQVDVALYAWERAGAEVAEALILDD